MHKNNYDFLIEQIVEFVHFTEKAKYTYRSSKTSNGNKDTVAGHSWRMAMLALLIAPYLKRGFSLEKTLKLITIHDLAELEIGDVNLIELLKNPQLLKEKNQKENNFFETLVKLLPSSIAEEFFKLWIEYEEKETYESKIVNAIDKLEAHLQNNESGSTYVIDNLKKMRKYRTIVKEFEFDSFIKKLFSFCLDEATNEKNYGFEIT